MLEDMGSEKPITFFWTRAKLRIISESYKFLQYFLFNLTKNLFDMDNNTKKYTSQEEKERKEREEKERKERRRGPLTIFV